MDSTVQAWWDDLKSEERVTLLAGTRCLNCGHLDAFHSCGCCWTCAVADCECIRLKTSEPPPSGL